MTSKEVVRVYRQILRLSRTWQALQQHDTPSERRYIREEARRLFRKNMKLSDEKEIKLCLEEAKSRIELAKHYQIPYPRPVNVAPNFVSSSKHQKGQIRRTEQSKPLYIHSQNT